MNECLHKLLTYEHACINIHACTHICTYDRYDYTHAQNTGLHSYTVIYLFSILEFIVNHNCVYDSCDISACHQINEDSDSDSENIEDNNARAQNPSLVAS